MRRMTCAPEGELLQHRGEEGEGGRGGRTDPATAPSWTFEWSSRTALACRDGRESVKARLVTKRPTKERTMVPSLRLPSPPCSSHMRTTSSGPRSSTSSSSPPPPTPPPSRPLPLSCRRLTAHRRLASRNNLAPSLGSSPSSTAALSGSSISRNSPRRRSCSAGEPSRSDRALKSVANVHRWASSHAKSSDSCCALRGRARGGVDGDAAVRGKDEGGAGAGGAERARGRRGRGRASPFGTALLGHAALLLWPLTRGGEGRGDVWV